MREWMMTQFIFETDWGWMGVAGSSAGLRQVVLPREARSEVQQDLDWAGPEQAVLQEDDPKVMRLLEQAAGKLRVYLKGQKVVFKDPLDWRGLTDFQRMVSEATRGIPYGEVRSYAWLAQKSGFPRAARAVGQCMARNQLPILVPCHRVIGSSGRLTGFGGGLELKERLLMMEGAL